MKIILIILGLFAVQLAAGPIEDLKPGEWFEIPDSRMDVLKLDPVEYPGIHAQDFYCVISCWCSAAYDTKRDRLITFGGGHASYWGNEEHVFDLNTFKWSRLNEPTPADQLDGNSFNPGNCPVDINLPCAIHTYDGTDYLPPPIDRHVVIGWGGKPVYLFDFDKRAWEVKAGYKGRSNEMRTGAVSAYDPVSGLLFQHQCFTSQLSAFDPRTNTWRGYGYNRYLTYYHTAAVDPIRRKFVAAGKGEVLTWDISNLNASSIDDVPLTTTGDKTAENMASPGFDYDPVTETFVAWAGGAGVLSLNPDTRVWTRHAPAATNTVIPTSPNQNGTYNRWRYVPSKNVFILLNNVNENVFIYRHTAASSAPQWYLDLIENGPTSANTARRAPNHLSMRIFPNPAYAHGPVRITVPGGHPENLRIFDVAGHLVIALEPGRAGVFAWNTKDIAGGLYFLAMNTPQGRITQKLLVLD